MRPPRSSATGPRCRRSPTGSAAGRRSTPACSPRSRTRSSRRWRQLRTRDSSDFSIALLDAWALTLDILTFYQERFANEAFLRTAVDQRSVIELAAPGRVRALPGRGRLGGARVHAVQRSRLARERPHPGGHAGAERAGAGPDPAGVRDLLRPDRADRLECAAGAHHAARGRSPKTTPARGSPATANNINVGDALLFVLAPGGAPEAADFHYVTAVNVVPGAATTPGVATPGATQITWDQPLSSTFAHGSDSTEASVYVFRKKAALYGVQAPNPETLPPSSIEYVNGAPAEQSTGASWNYGALYRSGNGSQVNLDASYAGLTPRFGGPPQWIVLAGTSHGLPVGVRDRACARHQSQLLHADGEDDAVDAGAAPDPRTVTSRSARNR